MELTERDKEIYDHLIDMDRRTGRAYTVDVLQKLMGKDAFRELYVRQAEEFTSSGAYVDSQIEGRKYSFVVVHELS